MVISWSERSPCANNESDYSYEELPGLARAMIGQKTAP